MNLRRIALVVIALSLAACGFHLRGSGHNSLQYSFKSLHLKTPADSSFVTELGSAIAAAGIVLKGNPEDAELVLELVSERTERQILSLSGSGRVNEYQLLYRVSLRAYDKQRIDWLPAEEILLTRTLAYDDAQVHAKEHEQTMLFKDMRTDAVSQAMRRLSRAKPRE